MATMELLDVHLPVWSTEKLKTVLEANHLNFAIPIYKDSGDGNIPQFNCWGYVAFNNGWEQTPWWIPESLMESHLAAHTVPVSKKDAKAGDVVIFRRNGLLIHTALMTHDPEIICHKPGANPLCLDTIKNAQKSYWNTAISYARPQAPQVSVS